jgi:septum site-determining protein MinC
MDASIQSINQSDSHTSVEFKGSTFTLSVLKITSSDMAQNILALQAKVAQAPSFFAGAPLVLDFESITAATPIDLSDLKQQLQHLNLHVVGIQNGSDVLKEQASNAGIAILHGKYVVPATEATPKTIYLKQKIIQGNVRSGQQIYAPNSNLIIHGAVSNGAEVIADGSIHITGSLRGKAMAGAAGNLMACVIARDIQAELIAIAGHYGVYETLLKHNIVGNGCVQLDNETLTITPFNT